MHGIKTKYHTALSADDEGSFTVQFKIPAAWSCFRADELHKRLIVDLNCIKEIDPIFKPIQSQVIY